MIGLRKVLHDSLISNNGDLTVTTICLSYYQPQVHGSPNRSPRGYHILYCSDCVLSSISRCHGTSRYAIIIRLLALARHSARQSLRLTPAACLMSTPPLPNMKIWLMAATATSQTLPHPAPRVHATARTVEVRFSSMCYLHLWPRT
jgi:hypothetical protein